LEDVQIYFQWTSPKWIRFYLYNGSKKRLEKKEINFICTKTKTKFTKLPNLIIIKRTTTNPDGTTSEELVTDEEERRISKNDIQNLFIYFEIIALKKISANVKHEGRYKFLTFLDGDDKDKPAPTPEPTPTPTPSPDGDKKEKSNGFGDLIGSLNLVAGSWKGIVDAFKTSKWNTLKERIPGSGFSKLVTTCINDNIESLEGSMLDGYITDFKSAVKLPKNSELSIALDKSIKYTKFSSKKMFSGNNIAFTKDGGGSTVFVTFLHRKNKDNTYDLMYSYFTAQFSLAPDIWVMNSGISLLGGIYENKDDYVKYVPRSVTDEDIKAVMGFMQLINFKAIYATLGFKDLPLP